MQSSAIYLRSRRGRGLSLLEVALVFGVAALLFAAVAFGLNYAAGKNKVKETLSGVGTIQQAVNDMFKGSPNYRGISGNILAASNQLPKKMTVGEGVSAYLTSAFGAKIGLYSSVDHTKYSIVLGSLPSDACAVLSTMNYGPALESLFVDSGKATAESYQSSLSPEEAARVCDADAGDSMVAFEGDAYQNSVLVLTFR